MVARLHAFCHESKTTSITQVQSNPCLRTLVSETSTDVRPILEGPNKATPAEGKYPTIVDMLHRSIQWHHAVI